MGLLPEDPMRSTRPISKEYILAAELYAVRWPDGLVCRDCAGTRFDHLRCRPRLWDCRDCGAQHSVTANTAMHGTHLSLELWALAGLGLMGEHGISANALATYRGISVESAWQLLHRMRAVLSAEPELLTGLCEQYRDVVKCRPPRDARHVEVAGVVDEEGRARIVLGAPRIGACDDLPPWGLADGRFTVAARRFRRHAQPPTLGRRAGRRARVLADGAQVARGSRWGPAERLLAAHRNQVMRTHRSVSERWGDRYASTMSYAWQASEQGSWTRAEESTHELFRRLLVAPRTRFADIRPPWDGPSPEAPPARGTPSAC